MTSSPLPRVGDLVAGKYRIESAIGEGGMGVVLGALDTSLNRPVAIKFLTPARAANEAAAQRFQREARAAAAIQSEHVVSVYEVGALPNGAPFIVMEHLRGSDLAHVIESRGGLPIDEAVDFVLQACEALGEAHARGIVHRDLKPQNLFLTQRNDGSACVKVLDFGISTSAEADASSPKLTKTDMVMGTPLYMSPEQVRSLKNVDARADVWALGAILHELLTASPPFDGPTASALHAAIAMDPPAPLRSGRPDAPEALEAVIARCLEKKPADRYQDVGALAEALAPFATERGRTSAGRIGNVVRATATSTTGAPGSGATPSGDAPTLPLGMASTMHATPPEEERRATDGAWEKKSLTGAPPKAPARVRAGVIAAVVLLLGGVALVAYASRRDPPAPPVVAAATTTTMTEAPAPPPVVSVAPSASASVVETPEPEVVASAAPRALVKPAAPASGAKKVVDDSAKKALAEKVAKVEQSCARSMNNMTLPGFESRRKEMATIAKLENCQLYASSSCQRRVCIFACQTLGDKQCVDEYTRMQVPAPF
ncbi:MAG: protein kinase [Labilithrix sp.]|nr:protein kinase [Labilithrix sp.]MCW5811826.1 protein kinase [Labilithrix sp.]